MARRTQHALVAAFVAALTVATYLPDADRYRVSSSSGFTAQRASLAGSHVQSGIAWRSRPVTAALSRAALLVPIRSRAARITTALTIAAATVTALTATVVLGLGGSTSAAIASALGLAFGAAFARHATTPASNLPEAAVCLALVAFLVSKRQKLRWTRLTSVACGAAIVALGFAAIAIPFYILVGLAMTWFVRYAAPYGRLAATTIIFLVPLLNAVEQYGAVRRAVDDNGLAAAVAEALPDALPANGVVVASDSRADQVHGYWRIGMPAPPLIDRMVSVAKRAQEQGHEVFAFASSRRKLEEEGLRFVTERRLDITIPLEKYLKQLPFRSIVVQGFGPQGASGLAAQTPFYGSIGIVGPFGLRRPLERSHTLPVDLRVEAGDPIGSTMLAPVPIRVLTNDSGIIIDVDRRYVVQTPAGMALAIVTPSGRVLSSHQIDTGAPAVVTVDAGEMEIGRVEHRALSTTGTPW